MFGSLPQALFYFENLLLTEETRDCFPTKKLPFFCSPFKLVLFIFLAMLGLCCWARAFSSCGEWEILSFAVGGLLIEVASLTAKPRPDTRTQVSVQHAGSAVVHGLSCSVACGILDQGSNLCSLNWQVDS